MDPEQRATSTIGEDDRRSPVVLRCRACGRVVLTGHVCSACGGSLAEVGIPPVGEVLAMTAVARVPDDVVLTPPYAVALVRLSEDAETLGVADPALELGVGDTVTLELERAARSGDLITFVRIRRESPTRGAGAP